MTVAETTASERLAQARAALGSASQSQMKAEEIFERRRESCPIQEYVSLKAELDRSNVLFNVRQREFEEAESAYHAYLTAEEKERHKQQAIARRAELNAKITETTEKMEKIHGLMRALPEQLQRLDGERNLLLAELSQITEVN
jgi:uncharacterized coiled-coil protein SlyX